VSPPNFLTDSCGIVEGISGVQTGPGATAFTRMPRFIAMCDSVLVMLTSAALVAAYGSRVGLGSNAWMDAVLTIALPGCIRGSAARQSQNVA